MASPKTAKKFGAALKDAWDVLNKYDTPEVATKLTGDERSKYLAALDQVYGPSAVRAKGMGFSNKDWYHGTGADIESFDNSRLGEKTTGPTKKLGHHFTRNPAMANDYAVTSTSDFLRQDGNVLPIKLRTRGGVAYEPEWNTLQPEDAELAQEHIKKTGRPVIFRNAADALWDPLEKRGDVAIVPDPKDIRSKFAAFDPRFKDSPLLMAGVGAGVGNKYEINRNDPNAPLREGGKALLGAAKKANDWYQENIVGPAAAMLKGQMTPTINVRGQEYETGNAMTDLGIEALVDPLTYAEGPIAAGVTAAQIAAEMAPQKKSKGGMVYKPKAEYIEKLYKGGKITKETAARCGYAEGGLVDPAKIDASQIQIDPSLMQAGQAMPAPMPQAVPQISVNPFGGVTKGIQNFREKLLTEPTLVEEARQKYMAAQAPQYQLASAQGAMPEGAVQLEQFGQAQASPQDGMPQMPMGGGADAAINQAVNAGMVEGVQTGAAIQTMQDTLKAAAAEEQQKAALAQEDFKAKQLEIDDLVGQYQKAAPNPQAAREQFWADKTTGQKVLAGIGLIFGAMSKDGVNRSVLMIEKAIDQNIEAQAKKQQSLGSLIGEKRGMLGDLRKMYGDERDARLAFKDQALKIAQLEIDKVASMTKSADVRAKYAVAKEELGIKRMQTQAELLKSAGKGKELLVPGVGYAATAGEATKAKELLGARNKSTSLIKDLMKYNRALPGSDASADAEVAAEMLRAALRPIILGPGTVQEKEYERLKGIATNPTEIFQVRNKRKLERLLQIVDSQVNAELSGMGLVPPQVQLKERAR